MAKPVKVGGQAFRTQKEALKYIADLRDRYEDGEPIRGADTEFLEDLLLLHPEAAQKTGCGVARFTVATEQVYNKTRHFVVRRNDGTETDFSFISCVRGADGRRDRLQALRVAIAGQIEAFKIDAFAGRSNVLCAVREVPTSFADADVDHEPPATFRWLVEQWLAQEGMPLDDIEISDAADNQIVSTMTNKAHRESWQLFHRNNAKLRITCRPANLSDVRTLSRRAGA